MGRCGAARLHSPSATSAAAAHEHDALMIMPLAPVTACVVAPPINLQKCEGKGAVLRNASKRVRLSSHLGPARRRGIRAKHDGWARAVNVALEHPNGLRTRTQRPAATVEPSDPPCCAPVGLSVRPSLSIDSTVPFRPADSGVRGKLKL